MRVQPSQLIEGSVLLKDVRGKTGHPIIKENTVLTNEHITILQKFLIESVEVSNRPVGKTFNPEQEEIKEEKPKKNKTTFTLEKEPTSFDVHYLQVVSKFKDEFNHWNNGVPIDISKVRNLIIPLLERVDELDIEPFTLQRYADAEEYIYHHSVAMSVISAFLGMQLGYEKGEWLQIGLAGLLSDAGMTRIDAGIITGGNLLSDKQKQDIRNHPVYSSRMVENLPAITPAVKVAILQHHERMDGSGYPLGLSQDKINDYARILAVSDTFHAMTSKRLFKGKQPVFKAIQELYNQQFSKFDPKVVRMFIKSFTLGSHGKNVLLSNSETGEIVFIDDKHPTKPLIKLDTTKEIISMQENPKLTIEDFIYD